MKPRWRTLKGPLVALVISAASVTSIIVSEIGLGSSSTRLNLNATTTNMVLPDRQSTQHLLPLEAYAEVAQRPLFSETRRPPQISLPPKPEPKPPSAAGFVLVGVVARHDDRVALIRTTASPKVEIVMEGGSIAEWKIEKIALDHIVLRAGDYVAELKLAEKSQKSSAGANQPPSSVPIRRPIPQTATQLPKSTAPMTN